MVGAMAIRVGFGTRPVVTDARELTVVGNGADSATEDFLDVVGDPGHIAIKEQVRSVLLARIDPAVAARMPRPQLLSEIRRLVNDIADQTRVRLNEREESILADELVDDMIGLGPLEPLLNDETVNDILVNGPNDVY